MCKNSFEDLKTENIRRRFLDWRSPFCPTDRSSKQSIYHTTKNRLLSSNRKKFKTKTLTLNKNPTILATSNAKRKRNPALQIHADLSSSFIVSLDFTANSLSRIFSIILFRLLSESFTLTQPANLPRKFSNRNFNPLQNPREAKELSTLGAQRRHSFLQSNGGIKRF